MQMGRAFDAALASRGTMNVVTAILRWRVVVRPEGYDAADESSAEGGMVTHGRREFGAFMHRVDHRLSGFQRFLEVQTGDIILDYRDDLALAHKEDVRVDVNGRMYVQKTASTALLEAWDVEIGSAGTLRTLLLTPVA